MKSTEMRREALYAPQAVSQLLQHDGQAYAELGAELRRQPPTAVVTIARGSSDHAAHFMGYLMMARLGRLVTSLPMSLITLYQTRLHIDGLMSVAFSQSGQSPDLIAPTRFIREGGARTLAFVNEVPSPLATAAQWVFPLHAGKELSVAATKSYIAQLVAGARLTATWQDDKTLQTALERLPDALHAAAQLSWQPAVDVLCKADKLFVIGRGTGLAIAMEAALKFKETCAIQAEAFSGAEVKHGPMALVEKGFPMLVFAPRGPAQASLLTLAEEMRLRGGRVLLAAPAGTPGAELPLVSTAHEDLDPIAIIQSFYLMVEGLAQTRGFNPDVPRHLAKVTQTV